MVSEDSCTTISNRICIDRAKIENNKTWLSNGISKMSHNTQIRIECDNEEDKNQKDIEGYVRELLFEICDSAVDTVTSSVVTTRNKRLSVQEKHMRKANRHTSVLGDDFNTLGVVDCRNNFVNLNGRSASVCVIDENDNKDYNKVIQQDNSKENPKESNDKKGKEKEKEKKKKKLSFNSFFGKKDKHKAKDIKEEEETHDNLAQLPVFPSNTLGKSKKYSSAMELHQYKKNEIQRKTSFIKKLVHISEDSSNFLKRSLSFRESKKPEKQFTREKLIEQKAHEWRQSLQSLVESDISVSYNDLSFINYDAMNDINYDSVNLRPGIADTKGGYIGRTQSMTEKRSPEVRRPIYQRVRSINDNHRLDVTSLPTSSAVSLPSLHHLNQDNVEATSESASSIHRYRRRPQSIHSDDGGGGSGSFRSAGSGCAKLKRHNACRQKVRDPTLLIEPRQNENGTDRTVIRIIYGSDSDDDDDENDDVEDNNLWTDHHGDQQLQEGLQIPTDQPSTNLRPNVEEENN